METIYADHTISISDFKARPAQIVGETNGKPLAVLAHNKPVFYAVPSRLFQEIANILDDYEIAKVVQERLNDPKIVDVSLDEL